MTGWCLFSRKVWQGARSGGAFQGSEACFALK